MSLPNLYELLATDSRNNADCYFQPRLILGCENLCAIESHLFKLEHQALDQAIKTTSAKYGFQSIQYMSNSILYENCDNPVDFGKSLQAIKKITYALDINKFYDLQTNFMRAESVIQRCMDNNLTKPVYAIFKFLLGQQHTKELQEVIMQDLPQLLNQNRVSINEFLDIDEDEIAKEFEDKKVSACNMEIILDNPNLPLLGDNQTYDYKLKGGNLFNLIGESEELIMAEYKKKEEE